MKGKQLLFILSIILLPSIVFAQTKTTEDLAKNHNSVLSLFFYNNTLRMLNQAEDKEFDALIKDIEKMKFLMIKKSEEKFDMNSYKKLVNDYKKESYDVIMTSRYEGKNFDIFERQKDGQTKGMLVLVNDEDNLFVLDIIGSLALNNVTKLYNTIDSSTDIGKRIKAFTHEDGDEKSSKEKSIKIH